jgi:hypothetical protein
VQTLQRVRDWLTELHMAVERGSNKGENQDE